VLVLEERDTVGGNTVTEELTLPGFAHDSCSSAHVLLQSNPLIREDELGLLAGGLRYVYPDPAVVLPRADDPVVMWRDRDRTAAELARGAPGDGEAFLRLLDEWDGGLRAAHGRWNAGRADPAGSGRQAAADARYSELRARSAWDVVHERFASARARDLLLWLSFATIQPVRRPGTGVLPFAITAGRTEFGWATPLGGSGALPDALVRVITGHGGRVRTGSAVTRVLVEDGRAAGVRTADGARWPARRAVLSTAHLAQLPGMIEGGPVPAELRAAAAAWRPGLTLFAVHLALAGDLTYATGHGEIAAVAGGLGTAAGLDAQLAAFGRGEADARDPWVLVVCSTAADRGRAPAGRGTGKLLTVAPYRLRGPDGSGADWDTERDRYAEKLLAAAAARIGGLSGAEVLAVRAESPRDLELRNRHNLGGSCHGGEVLGPGGEVLAGWPHHRLAVPGLYQTGATTHPGGSVAGRAGRNAARVLLTDLGIAPEKVMGPD
jgi:phytoene dehydrogenase-like protein